VEVEARIVRLQLAETFVIAREAADYADVVHVAVTHDGVTGYGEAAPVERYGESAESALRFMEDHG
jgi:L-alanine-DL-glutamate epimerase-like enolase superfamily enzyme